MFHSALQQQINGSGQVKESGIWVQAAEEKHTCTHEVKGQKKSQPVVQGWSSSRKGQANQTALLKCSYFIALEVRQGFDRMNN